jgi:hypothetical protein
VITSNPTRFAECFNTKVPEAYRKITSSEVRLMTECNLIGRYHCYTHQDLETVINMQQYERLREKLPAEQEKENKLPSCKLCLKPLPLQPEGKAGRPKEYCLECESQRNQDRQKKLRHRRYNSMHVLTSNTGLSLS